MTYDISIFFPLLNTNKIFEVRSKGNEPVIRRLEDYATISAHIVIMLQKKKQSLENVLTIYCMTWNRGLQQNSSI